MSLKNASNLLLAVSLTVLLVTTGVTLGQPDRSLSVPATGRASLVYVFNWADCDTYLEFQDSMARLASATGLDIRGVLLTDTPSEAGRAEEEIPVPFPVSTQQRDRYVRAGLALGIYTTPFVLLVDPAGHIRMAVPPTTSSAIIRTLDASLRSYATALVPR